MHISNIRNMYESIKPCTVLQPKWHGYRPGANNKRVESKGGGLGL